MFRLSSICPFCEAQAAIKATRLATWQQPTRGAATLQQRKPSRMTLSPNVRRGPRPDASNGAGGKPAAYKKPRSRNSPFGGMNITEPPREFQHPSKRGTISAAEQKRATRFAATKAGGREREGGKNGKSDPMKALKMQRALANVSYEKRGRVKQELAERETFGDFDLLPAVKEAVLSQALGGVLDVSPTPIQRLAIPALLGTEDGKRRRRKEVVADASVKKAMQQFLLAAETGSGKTLAYVLPVIDAIKRAEKAEAEQERTQAAIKQREEQNKKASQLFELESPPVNEPDTTTGRPRAIILLPTSELVNQVGALLKSLSHTVKFRSAMISASYTSTVIRSRLFGPAGIDVVISTPHLLSSITESDPNLLSRVTHLVIDEADSLLDRSFSPITSALIDRATPSLQQLVLCSATIPRSLDAYLYKRFPEVRRLVTPNLHAIPRRVQLSVVDIEKVPYQGNRDLACAQTIYDIGKDTLATPEEDADGDAAAGGGGRQALEKEKKIVVFVNEREKTLELAEYLRSKGIDATALSRDSDERKQAEILAAFTGAAVPAASQKQKQKMAAEAEDQYYGDGDGGAAISPADLPFTNPPRGAATPTANYSPNAPISPPATRRHLPNTKVLVMTDLGSRGIDTTLTKHVILYDVPHTSIDFIHRLGRVGRMGQRGGRGVVLVGRNDRKDVVREVREGMFKGQALI
ncbi:hypothetical protein LTR36_008106 [Oleoguttula mirabilis]|uniref:RNA helicase n=1 Tax=Oleoguttula mirabilis TaxID=1507867 RepID=A0AAV9J901_9PEZI|nr:hypothetical protein LTR36_008106 [Oleoguttula mirabilis]